MSGVRPADSIAEVTNSVTGNAVRMRPDSGNYKLDEKVLYIEHPDCRADQWIAISKGFGYPTKSHSLRVAYIIALKESATHVIKCYMVK